MTIVASDDGVHADGTLTISGGNVLAKEAWEGVEGNIINVTGGETIAYTVKFANGSVSVPNLPYTYSGCYAWSSLGSISSIS